MKELETDRERLNREVASLDDDQVLEVLEYILVMKSLTHQEVTPKDPSGEVSQLQSSEASAYHASISSKQTGDILIFPRSRRAVSK